MFGKKYPTAFKRWHLKKKKKKYNYFDYLQSSELANLKDGVGKSAEKNVFLQTKLMT